MLLGPGVNVVTSTNETKGIKSISHEQGLSAKIDSFNVKSLALFGSAARDESHALSAVVADIFCSDVSGSGEVKQGLVDLFPEV